MTDAVDIAQERAELLRDVALAEVTGRFRPPALEYCYDCGGQIPEERREALADLGATRCVSCQTIAERGR